MAFTDLFKSVASLALNYMTGKPSTSTGPLTDIKTGAGAVVSVVSEAINRNLTLNSAEIAVNDIQQILVDFGIEPAIVLEASKLLESLAPMFLSAYESGIITGGYRPLEPDASDHNSKDR